MYNPDLEVNESEECEECVVVDHGIVPNDTYDSPLVEDAGYGCCVTGYGTSKDDAMLDALHKLMTYGWWADVCSEDLDKKDEVLDFDPEKYCFAITMKVR